MNLVMQRARALRNRAAVTARTIRFSSSLRSRLAADAERCARSFEAQVLAILRRHYGEDVDIAPAPETILALAFGSLAGMSDEERTRITQRFAPRYATASRSNHSSGSRRRRATSARD